VALVRPTHLSAALVAVPVLLAAATGYEIALAAGALSIGRDPGDGAPGEDAVLASALLVMAIGTILAGLTSSRPAPRAALALVAPASAAFALARFYTYDPYYAPSLRRMSDGGLVNPIWMYGLLVAAVAVGAIAWRRPRSSATLTAACVAICAVTALVESGGH